MLQNCSNDGLKISELTKDRRFSIHIGDGGMFSNLTRDIGLVLSSDLNVVCCEASGPIIKQRCDGENYRCVGASKRVLGMI